LAGNPGRKCVMWLDFVGSSRVDGVRKARRNNPLTPRPVKEVHREECSGKHSTECVFRG
jgi:hypothetical protein